MTDIPVVMTPEGPVPTPPATLRQDIVDGVTATNPDYTVNLPGALIEDVLDTQVGGLSQMDTARVETINSVSPLAANEFILAKLGAIYGVEQNVATNTSVNVVFSGPPGYIVAKGFLVSDGTNTYQIQDGGAIASGGTTSPLFVVCTTTTDSFAVPPNTVTQLVTIPPTGLSPPLTVNNPIAGTPGADPESVASYRSRVLQAGLAVAQGMPTFLKTILSLVSGVQPRLISVAPDNSKWQIIVGGGDPYEVAYAIYTALFDISTLEGATIAISGVSNANPGVVTTLNNHNLTTGNVETIAGVLGMTGVNGSRTITVITEKTFSIGVDTTGSGTYTGGGTVSPNPVNQSVNLSDSPNIYAIPFVIPPQQVVTISLTWNTTSSNFVSNAAFAQLAGPAIVAYINGLQVGAPINLFEMQAVVQNAVAPILDPNLLTRMVFIVNINGISTSPSAGTGIIPSDPSSYFFASSTAVSFTQG